MKQQERDALINQLTKDLTDKGKLIEAGFASMLVMGILKDAEPQQVADMRTAFFAGAQHVFGTLMNILDPGDEPTDADMRRIDLIDKELREFITEFAKKNLPTAGNA